MGIGYRRKGQQEILDAVKEVNASIHKPSYDDIPDVKRQEN